MDSITQAALGAAVAAAVAPKKYRKRAVLTGVALGTLPDLDVLIRHANDIDNFIQHRSFSHSLFVLPLVAIALLPLLRRLYRDMSWQHLYLLIVLTLVTHPLLDALTAYSTQLFYPLDVTPTFIGSVFILDPLYTVWLLLGVVIYLFSERGRWANHAGLIISTLYLALGIGMQNVARNQLVAAYPNTAADKWFVGALLPSPLCWHGAYKDQDRYIETILDVRRPENMIVREYAMLPVSAYPKSPALERLLWANPDIVLRQRDGKLVTSDLRMGEFGFYSFEFIITPESGVGTRLDMFDKPQWQPDKENTAARAFDARNKGKKSFGQRKLALLKWCLGGEH